MSVNPEATPTNPAPAGQRCSACAYGFAKGGGNFTCYRFAPAPVRASLFESTRHTWPTVKGDDWCGDWKAKSA